MKIGVIPLDERPVNTRYPAMIAAIAGARVALPPPEILSARRRPAGCAALAAWLEAAAPTLDGLIVSCDMLGYGSLIASRTSDDPAGAILARLDTLRTLRRRFPKLPIYGFNVISRVSNADDAVEEPAYWARYGRRFYQFSQLLDRREQGQDVAAELGALAGELPAAHRADFLRRRLRNHAVNLGVLHLLAEGVLDLLVLSSDDTSPFGLPSREKRWLAEWAGLLEPGERLLMYPGADEVQCVLLARLLNERSGARPRLAVRYAPPEAAANVAAFEDGPIRVTVERQARAAGAELVEERPDLWLAVNAPVARRSEWAPEFAEAERRAREPALGALLAEIARRQARGEAVAVADVAYPNGADPALVEPLLDVADLPRLAAYGAWNTAGNTIGTVLAQALAARMIASEAQRVAHERFLAHRFVEDWGYQQIARAEVRRWLREEHGAAEPTPATLAAALARIERGLGAALKRLPGLAGRYTIAPGSVRLPWGRTFEVDFEVV